MRDETTRAPARCSCDGCDLGTAGCCSPLTRAAVADLADLRPRTMVVVLGMPALDRLPRAAQAVLPGGRILVVPGCGEPGLARLVGPNVQLVGGTFDRIQLPTAIADLVTSCCTIHRFGDMSAIYREMHRILKVGGRFVVSDLIGVRSVFEASALATFACQRPPRTTEAAYVQAVREVGFSEVTILQRTAAYSLGGVLVSSMVLSATRSAP